MAPGVVYVDLFFHSFLVKARCASLSPTPPAPMFLTTLKESLKPKGRDKASGEGVYAFAKNIYKVVKNASTTG
jgi:hypothetical protein